VHQLRRYVAIVKLFAAVASCVSFVLIRAINSVRVNRTTGDGMVNNTLLKVGQAVKILGFFEVCHYFGVGTWLG
jgi:hypothetical protein